MMAVHEAGHVFGAWLTGGTVERVVLHPLAISRTDLVVNPHPVLVAWAGPLFGVLLPVLCWLIWCCASARSAHAVRWFAGFCAVANGAYIGLGSLTGDGDAGDLLRDGVASWQLIVFGIVSLALGLWLWHGLGRSFSEALATARHRWLAPIIAITALLAVVIIELAIGSR
jgi:hypothetical protein